MVRNNKKITLEELRVERNWITLISFCQESFPYGQLCYKLVKGVPTELVEKFTRPKKRFDVSPVKLDFSHVEEDAPDVVIMKVPLSWINLINFCRNSFPYGQMGIEIVNCEPRELIEKLTKIRIRFDRPETIPQVFENISEPVVD